MMRTVEDLQNIYPKVIPRDRTLGQAESSTREVCSAVIREIEFTTNGTQIAKLMKNVLGQGLIHLYNALRFLEGSWAKHNNWISYFDDSAEDNLENVSLDQLGTKRTSKIS